MNRNFKCPLCDKWEPMSHKLHGTWQCPNCKNIIVPTAEARDAKMMPKEYMRKIYGTKKKYKREQHLKRQLNKQNKNYSYSF